MTVRETALWFSAGIGGCLLTAFLFYRSAAAAVLLLPVSVLYVKRKKRELAEKRRELLRTQFREAIQILASSLAAGYSVENGFAVCVRELVQLYGPDEMICREFSYMEQQMHLSRSPETLLISFGERSGVEEIRMFAEIFAVSRRSRGGVRQVIVQVTDVIAGRIKLRQELLVMTAEKRLEQRIMELIPFGMIFYVELTSPGFFSLMYETAAGRIWMTACLALYAGACILAERILKLPV